MAQKRLALRFEPLTAQRWPDLEALFGDRGACGGCWCMYWRRTRSDFERHKGDGNRAAFRALVEAGPAPGLLGYHDGRPVGWVALGPRETTPGLDRSRVLKRIDDEPVWSVTCLFVARDYRHKGVSVRLLKAAVRFAREQGAAVVEGYPVEPTKEEVPAPFVWTGLASAFRQAGFVEAARRSPTRPVMRRAVTGKRK